MLPLVSLFALTRAITDMELTYETFDEAVFRSNRSAAFIEFYTFNCADCLKMEEDWEAVGEEHEDSTRLLIGRVNCDKTEPTSTSVKSGEGSWSKLLCDRYKVVAYPTLLYFTPPLPEPDFFYYRGDLLGRAGPLHEFARNLSNSCPASAVETCTEAQQEELKEYIAAPTSDLEEAAHKLKYELDMANYERLTSKKELAMLSDEKRTKKRVKKLEAAVETAAEKLSDLVLTFGHRYRIMRSVLASRYEPPEELPKKQRMTTKMPKRNVIEAEPEIKLSKAENRKFQKQMQEMQRNLFKGKDPATMDWGKIKEQMMGGESAESYAGKSEL